MALELYQSTRSARLYREALPDGSRRGFMTTAIGTMNHESVLDSGVYDTPVDMTLTRVTNADLDGYLMTNAGWHYAIQTVDPAASTAQPNTQRPRGSVGFGGRKGQNWFWFRLQNVGYLHWPTRTVDDLGGAPDYSNPVQVTHSERNIGKHPALPDEMQTHKSAVTWPSIWTTPGGGDLTSTWGVRGSSMKQDIWLNQEGREWLEANRPPSTPANETYFGFRFRLDVSDIPRAYKQGLLQDLNGDFDDGDGDIELRDATDRLLAFMPLDFVIAEGNGGKRPLRKRFYRDAQSRNWLYVGCRVDQLNQLLPGALRFDPQMTQEVITANSDDGFQNGGAAGDPFDTTPNFQDTLFAGETGSGNIYDIGVRFTPNLPQGADTTTGSNYATLSLYSTGGFDLAPNPSFRVVGDDVDNAATFQDGDGYTPRELFTYTTAYYDITISTDPGANTAQTFDVSSIVEEIIGRAGWSANNGLRMAVLDNGTNNAYISIYDYQDATGNPAALDVYYTTGGGAANPKGPLGMPLHGPFGGPIG